MLIAQLSDMHLRPEGQLLYDRIDTARYLERAVAHVLKLDPRPDVAIMTGDLVEAGKPEEYARLRRLIAPLPMPVYVIPGNHDRRETMKQALRGFPGIGDDPEFIHYTVDDLPVRLVMLDSVVPGASHGELCAARLGFLDRALAAAPDKPTIVVLHHAPIACGIAMMDEINLRTADTFAAIIARHPQVERVLCGHHHRPIVARWAGTVVQIAPSVAHQVTLDLTPGAEGSLIMEPPAYLLHRWTPASGLVSHQAYVGTFAGPYPFA